MHGVPVAELVTSGEGLGGFWTDGMSRRSGSGDGSQLNWGLARGSGSALTRLTTSADLEGFERGRSEELDAAVRLR